ncbi:MAG: hypothetical protein PHP29_08645, partial [Tissierellia bacterium]|nr:hypothetical protein [Tissierellia bacterium]
MKKIIVSWILIISMVLMQVVVPSANLVVYGQGNEIVFASGEASDWIGREPKAGDQIFYIEVRGNNLAFLEAEVSDYANDIHTPIASQRDKWDLGNTSSGEERYIYEMIVEGGGALNEESLYYIRLKDSENIYYDNNSAYFQCWGDNYSLSINTLLSEISTNTESLSFDLTLHGADTSLAKDELSLSLYSGTKESIWDDVTLDTLVGTSDNFETMVIGNGQIQIKGEFQITGKLVGGQT